MKRLTAMTLLGALALLPARALFSDSERPVPQQHYHHARATAHPGTAVEMTSELSHGALLRNGAREAFLYLSLSGQGEVPKERPSIDLALVIDRSGSMASDQKLEFAKSAALQLAGRLRPDDRLAIVTYDDRVAVPVPSQSGAHRKVFRDAIESIQTGGSTNLFGGMLEGFRQVLAGVSDGRPARVLLLSDGLANIGPSDPIEVGSRAAECRRSGVRISTMGMGLSYDDVLMRAIARESGGNYFYIAEPEQVGGFLERELDELGRVVARNPVVTIRLAPGVWVTDVYGYSFQQEGNTLRIPVPDIMNKERRKIMLRLMIDTERRKARPIAQASLHYTVAATEKREAYTNSGLSVRLTDDADLVASLRNRRVLSKAEVALNGVAILQATDLQRDGRLDAALELLDTRHSVSQRFNSQVLQSPEVDRTLERMLQVRADLEVNRYRPDTLRDTQLRGALEALGYIGDD